MKEENEVKMNHQSEDEKAISNVAEVVYVQHNSGKTKDDIETEITEAYNKMINFIDEKLLPLKEIDGIDPSNYNALESQIKSNARKDFFTSVLSVDIEDMESLISSVAIDAIKPMLSVDYIESELVKDNRANSLIEERVNDYIENIIEEYNESRDEEIESSQKVEFAATADVEKKGLLEKILGSNMDKTEDLNLDFAGLDQNQLENIYIKLSNSELSAKGINLVESAFTDMMAYSGVEIPDTIKAKILCDMSRLAAQNNPTMDMILESMASTFNINIYKDGDTKTIDRETIYKKSGDMLLKIGAKKLPTIEQYRDCGVLGRTNLDKLPKNSKEFKEKVKENAKIKEYGAILNKNVIADKDFDEQLSYLINKDFDFLKNYMERFKDVDLKTNSEKGIAFAERLYKVRNAIDEREFENAFQEDNGFEEKISKLVKENPSFAKEFVKRSIESSNAKQNADPLMQRKIMITSEEIKKVEEMNKINGIVNGDVKLIKQDQENNSKKPSNGNSNDEKNKDDDDEYSL